MTTNIEEIKSRGKNRYSLKDHDAAKRTISRLTREVLRGDIDPEKCRAAIYCINSLIQIFKIEAPQKIEAQFAGALKNKAEPEMNPDELQKSIDELTTKLIPELIPDYEKYLKWQERKSRKLTINQAQISCPNPETLLLPESEINGEAEDFAVIEDTGAWKPVGIGARRIY
jgi:ferredoxin